MYTIEFQKRDIDRIIFVEIPNHNDDPELYNLVKSHMIHGPCGTCNMSSPCMKDGKYSRYFPKKFNNVQLLMKMVIIIVEKNGIPLDNHYVVPYNPQLLMKYQTHINMEWCNQSYT
ncbi:hypothetical protein Lal_00040435 [Lupinus albus]|nr:hypothetical protein Lal_00040435 [Lupinus albus]